VRSHAVTTALGLALAVVILTLDEGVNPALAQSPAKGFLGVGLKDLPGNAGAQVRVLAPGGPAEQAGVRLGDVIVAVDGQPTANTAAVVGALARHSPGERAELWVRRGGQALTLQAVMGTPPPGGAAAVAAQAGAAAPPTVAGPPSGSAAAMQGPTFSGAAAARTPPSTPAASRPLKVSTYATFTEPSEHAFTMEVPSGWAAVGSLMRRGALEISPFVRTLSPDRMTYLMVGEPTLLSYTPPSLTTQRLGWREGSLHDSGLGGISMLLRYIPGAQFAQLYGQSALAGLCRELRFTGAQPRPDFVAAADQLIPTVIPSQSSGGEATFSCRHGGQDMLVRVDAVTRTTRDNVLWNVIFLRALITPRGQLDAAQEILKHMTLTFRFDPAWVQRQNQISQQAAAAINRQAQAFLAAERTVIAKLNATDESFSEMDDIVSGYSNYRDERTGNVYKLSNTNPGKWIDDSSGRIVSTPDNNPPPWAPGYSALTRVP
jgi:hypothetical protein